MSKFDAWLEEMKMWNERVNKLEDEKKAAQYEHDKARVMRKVHSLQECTGLPRVTLRLSQSTDTSPGALGVDRGTFCPPLVQLTGAAALEVAAIVRREAEANRVYFLADNYGTLF